MPECIEKKKLLKAIEESEPDVMADYGEYYGSEWGISRGKLYEIIANLPTLTQPNEWVSVEDEIPSDDDDGLEFFCMTNATGKGGGVLPMEWEVVTIRGKTVRRWKWLNRISPWAVTHWMKRPAPPDCRPPEGEEET